MRVVLPNVGAGQPADARGGRRGYPDATRGAGTGFELGACGRRSGGARCGGRRSASRQDAAAAGGRRSRRRRRRPPARSTSVTATGASLPGPSPRTVARVRRQLRGIPQHALVLGSPTAPVTIVEYGHFACPTCAAAHRDVLPRGDRALRAHRQGEPRVPRRRRRDAVPRARPRAGAAAASAQRRGWDFVQLAYLRGLEKPGPPGNAVGVARPARDRARPRHGARGTTSSSGRRGSRRSRPPPTSRPSPACPRPIRCSCSARGRSPEQPFVVLTAPSSVRRVRDGDREGAAPARLTPSPAAP